MYRGDPFTASLCAALDDLLAPALAVLDNLPAHLDLALAPEDLLPWLATWVGIELDPGLDPVRQRELLRAAAELHGWQGTARGIAVAVEALMGVPTEVVETGGATWSNDPRAALPGEPVPAVVVRVHPDDPDDLDDDRLEAVVAAVKPAHVMHRVQVVEG
jgi:phage tail-like protein